MDHRQVTRRVARGLVAGLAVALPVVLASGWYYLRNRRLYGDLLGAKYAVTLFPGPHLGLNATLFSETFWAGQLRQLLTRPGYVTGAVRLLGHVVIVVIALGLLSLLVRTVPRLRGQRPATTSILVAGLLAADFLLGWTDEFRYVAMGGFGYIRYALPAFPVLALLVGLALLALPLGRRGAFVVAVVGVLSAISIVVLSKGISFHHRGWEPYGILERYRVGLLENGLPVPTLLLGALLALVVLALAGLTFSLVRCTRPAQLSDEGVAA